jgi:hypothetical protein
MMGPRIWSLATLIVAVLVSSGAQALTVSSNIRREVEKARLDPMTLSRADCLEGNGYLFRLQNIAIGQPISVWATQGTCTQQDRTMGLCVEIVPGQTFQQVAEDNFLVEPGPIAEILPFVTACVPGEGAPSGSTTVNLFFFENLASDPSIAGIQVPIAVDVVGPRPPTNPSVGVGSETTAQISWNQSPDQTIDVNGYRVYCYPPAAAPDPTTTTATTTATTGVGGAQADMHVGGGGGALVGGAGGSAGFGGFGGAGGASGTGGVGATTTATVTTTAGVTTGTGGAGGASCDAGNLVAGEFPPAGAVPCASVSNTSTSVAVEGLTFGQRYAFAVAAFDRVENDGPLSEIVCGETEPTIDFFEAYRAAGGQGGGGMCNCSVIGGLPHGRWALYLTIAGGLALGIRRRRNA